MTLGSIIGLACLVIIIIGTLALLFFGVLDNRGDE